MQSGYTQFFKDFAVTFAYALRYYITGLIIGYFLCVIFKKCYYAWIFDRECTGPLTTQIEVPNEQNRLLEDVNEDQEQVKDGSHQFKKGTGTNNGKPGDVSRSLDLAPSVQESDSVVKYWKKCFDNLGFVVVDTMNPVVPFGTSGSQRSTMTLRWNPNHGRDELLVRKINKSSSTTDIKKITCSDIAKYSQVRSGDLKCRNNQDSCVDTHDLINPHALMKALKKFRNKRLDTSGLKNVEKKESHSVASQITPKSNVILAVSEKLSTTSLKDTVESTLIPGQKVTKDAVIVLRLRDKHLSACDVFDEEVTPLPSRKKISLGSRNRIRRPSYYRISSEKRKHKGSLKPRRDSGIIITSDENSSGSTENNKKRNLLSLSKFSTSNLQCPFSKKRILLSDERYKNRTVSRKRLKHNSNGSGRRNQSPVRHSSKQLRTDTTANIVQDISKRSCFKYRNQFRKRQKVADNSSKPDIRSLSRFLSEFRKSSLCPTKKSILPPREEDVYQIEVKESADGLRIRSKSKCRFSDTPSIMDRVKQSIGNYSSKERVHMAEPLSSSSRHRISESSRLSEPDESAHIGKVFGGSMLSIGISNNQSASRQNRKSKELIVTNYSDISTGSESISIEDLNFPLPEDRKVTTGSAKVDELIVALGENCNKNGRSQFWRIFGSNKNGKSN